MKDPTMNRMTRISTLALALSLPAVAHAQDDQDTIVVTAQRANQSEVTNGGSAGVLGNKAAEDLPFTIRTYNESLILNQQPQTLGDVLENDATIRTTYGFGNAAEQFVVRGFTLFGDDVGVNGLYGIGPRQLVAPQLYGSVQVLNGASAFLNGAAPGGTGLGGSVNLLLKRGWRTRSRAGYRIGGRKCSLRRGGRRFAALRRKSRMGRAAEWRLSRWRDIDRSRISAHGRDRSAQSITIRTVQSCARSGISGNPG